MKNIFFVGNLNKGSTFIDNDYKELQKYFNVRYTEMKLYSHLNILQTLKNVIWCDEIYGWFASWRMVIPTIFAKIFKKKIVVVAGGYDVVAAKSINYGAYSRLPDAQISTFVFKHADIVLPVSKSIRGELLEKVTPKNVKIVYNGVDTKKFYPQGGKDNNLILTVGEVNWSNLTRKGIEDFVRAAKYLPDKKFVVIGKVTDEKAHEYLKSIATPNVSFAGYIENTQLAKWYQKAKVYCQLSYHEGFGVAVAESMLCNCIPVVTNKGALSEVVGKFGFYVPYNSPSLTAVAIKEALKDDRGNVPRERIIEKFSLSKRIKELRRILK